MQVLLDGDIVLYEIGSIGQGIDPESGEEYITSFDYVKEKMDAKIAEINKAVGATEPVRIFLTGKGNFREQIAIRKGYKANRKDVVKPFHYANLKGYLIAEYGAEVCDGYEADDGMCIAQKESMAEGIETIICSRDKDLRQCCGWHYSWECGKQPSWGPKLVEGFGELLPTYFPEGHKRAGKLKDLKGTGDKWFLAQLLMGDTTDNIPGLPGWGPVKVFQLLADLDDYQFARDIVWLQYWNVLYDPDKSDDENHEYIRQQLTEQAQLVWMVRERNEDGSLKMWSL